MTNAPFSIMRDVPEDLALARMTTSDVSIVADITTDETTRRVIACDVDQKPCMIVTSATTSGLHYDVIEFHTVRDAFDALLASFDDEWIIEEYTCG